jgi:pimeloyl-ACP methyl ester carboxylesterase
MQVLEMQGDAHFIWKQEVTAMPYANNQGVRIHYEVEGDGPPLVLMHFGLISLEMWRIFGFVELLKNDYRLIMLDDRGHGGSDKPHDPEAYRMVLKVADVIAVLDDLHISKAHYLGYSLGGGIGYAIAKYAPERFYSLILGGATLPRERDPEPRDIFKVKEGMGAHLAFMEALAGPRWTPEVRAIHEFNDLDAFIARDTIGEGLRFMGFEDGLPNVTLPCLLYWGEGDEQPGFREAAMQMPNVTVVVLPGLDHLEAGCRADLVVPHVRKFLAEVGED